MSWPVPLPHAVVIKISTFAAKKIAHKKFASCKKSYDRAIREDLPNPNRWSNDRTDFKTLDHTNSSQTLIIARFNANTARVFCVVHYSGSENKIANVYISDVAYSHTPKERNDCVARISKLRPDELHEWDDVGPKVTSSTPPPQGTSGYTEIPHSISDIDYNRIMEWAKEDINLVLTQEQGEIIFKPSPILINGQAGTGKSTMIAYRLAMMLDLCYLEKECQNCFGSDSKCQVCDDTKIAKKQPKEIVAKNRRILMTCYSSTLVETIKEWTGKILTNLDFLKVKKGVKGTRRSINIENAPVDFIPFPELAKSFIPNSRTDKNGKPIPGRSEHFRHSWNRVSFARFRRDFYNPLNSKKYPAEYVWHSIRTYIKGMAVTGERTYLSLEDYHKNNEIREQYEKEQWRDMLDFANKYEKYLSAKNLWDDLDLAQEALRSIKKDQHRYCNHCQGFEKEYFQDTKTESIPNPLSRHKGKKSNISLNRRKVTFQNSRWVSNCKHCDEEGKIDRPIYWNYNEVYLDEAQDLTRVEFELLNSMTRKDANVFVKIGELPLIFAGDPNQTVNPTGFNWKQIVQLIWKGEKIVVNQLTTNHRTHARIVALSNMVQRRRRQYLRPADAGEYLDCNECQGQGVIEEESCMECDGDGMVTINLQDSHDKMKYDQINHIPTAFCLKSDEYGGFSEFIDNITTHSLDVRFLIAQEGFLETIKFLEDDPVFGRKIKSRYPSQFGNNSILDDISKAFRDKSGTGTVSLNDDEMEPDMALAFIMEKYNISSISSIKGHEHDAVVIYNFSTLPDFKKWTRHTIEKLDFKKLEYISLMFHLNRLYISTTRPRNHLILIDQEGDLWMDDSWKDPKISPKDLPELIITKQWDQAGSGLRSHPLFEELDERSPYEIGMEWFNIGVKENDIILLIRAKSKFEDSESLDAKNKVSEIDARVAMNNGDWKKAGEAWGKIVGRNSDAAECYEKAEDYSKAAIFYKKCFDNAPDNSNEKRFLEAKYLKNVMMDSSLSKEEMEKIYLEFFKFVSNEENRKYIDHGDLPPLAKNLDNIREHDKAFIIRTEILGDPNSVKAAIDKYLALEKYKQARSYILKNKLRKEYNGEYIECLTAIADKHISKGENKDAASLYSTAGEFDDHGNSEVHYEKAGDLFAEHALTTNQVKDWAAAADCYDKGQRPNTGANGLLCKAFSTDKKKMVTKLVNFEKAIEHHHTIKAPLKSKYTKEEIHNEIITCSHRRNQIYQSNTALKIVVKSCIALQRIPLANELISKYKEKKNDDDAKIIHASLLVHEKKYDEAVAMYFEAGATRLAENVRKEYNVTIDVETMARLKADARSSEFKKNKDPKIKIEEYKLRKEAGEDYEANNCLEKAIQVGADLSEKIDIIKEALVDEPNQLVNVSIRWINKDDKTPEDEKKAIKEQMVKYMKDNIEQLELDKIINLRIAIPWIKQIIKSTDNYKEKVDLLRLCNEPLELMDFYDKHETDDPRWATEGRLECAPACIKKLEEDTQKPVTGKWYVKAIRDMEDNILKWEKMIEDNDFESLSDNESSDDSDDSAEEQDLSSLKVTELKELLKAAGKAVGGKKADLIARLKDVE